MQAIQLDMLPQVMPAAFASRALVGHVLDFLGDARLATVSHLFHDAMRQSMMRTVRTLRGRDPQELAKIEAYVKRHFTNISAETYGDFEAILSEELLSRDTRGSRIVSAARARALQAVDPQDREHNTSTLHAMYCLEHGVPQLATRLSMVQQCQTIVEEEHLDPAQPGQVSAFLAALHKRQKHEAYALGANGARTFRESRNVIPRAHSGAHAAGFLSLQRGLLTHVIDTDLDESLCRLWSNIAFEINIPHPQGLAPAPVVRAWMNDPAHGQALDATQALYLNARIVPPEIGKLRGLQSLTVHEDARGLPYEIRNLQNLRTLRFHNSGFVEFPEEIRALRRLTWLDIGTWGHIGGGTFHELPEWLADMPRLEKLHVNAPLHVLSDAVWRSYWQADILTRIEDLFGARRPSHPYGTHLAINANHLTDMPFSCWFKQNVYVPYLPVLQFLEWMTSDINRWLHATHRAAESSWFTLVPFSIFVIVPVLLSIGLALTLHGLLNAPAFLANLLLDYAIEPALTALRDALGCSRMVHVRDLEPGEA